MTDLLVSQFRILHLLKRGLYGDAADITALIAAAWPEEAAIWHVLGACLEKAGRYGPARQAYRRALVVDPAHADARAAQATLRGRILARAEALESSDPERAARLYVEMQAGDRRGDEGKLQQLALREFGQERAIAEGLVLWGAVKSALAEPPRSRPASAATRSDPITARDLCRQAAGLESQLRLEEAASHYRKAIDQDPSSPDATDGLRRVRALLIDAPSGTTVIPGIGRVAFEGDRRCRRLRRLEGARGKRALLIFFAYGALLDEDDGRFAHHSIDWEARTLTRLLLARGYDVDVVDIDAPTAAPTERYDLAIGIDHGLVRARDAIATASPKIALFTGSWPPYQNEAESLAIKQIQNRRGGTLKRHRGVADWEAASLSCELADVIALVGNAVTKATFPQQFQAKVDLIYTTASHPVHVKRPEAFVPAAREFLWFGGRGLALKGLDIILELFAEGRWGDVHIVGPIASELDFEAVYRRELYEHARIHTHGFLSPASRAMAAIADRCFAFIMPSASESMSTAALTCMAMGLLPILTPQTGITLPEGCGIMLPSRDAAALSAGLAQALALSPSELSRQIAAVQAYALSCASREAYVRQMQACFDAWGVDRISPAT